MSTPATPPQGPSLAQLQASIIQDTNELKKQVPNSLQWFYLTRELEYNTERINELKGSLRK